MGLECGPRPKNEAPGQRNTFERRLGEATSQPEDPFIELKKFVLKDGSPQGWSVEESLDPLSLESRNLGARSQKTEPALKARTSANGPSRSQARVVIPKCIPGKGFESFELLSWRRREAALVPEATGEQCIGEQSTALEGDTA